MTRQAHILPPWLEPVLAFANTVDIGHGTDELRPGPAALSAWLTARGLLDAAMPVTRADYRLALDLRSGLRTLALLNNGGPAEESGILRMRHALDRLPLLAGVDHPGLHPYRLTPTRSALAVIAAGYARATATEAWSRIRGCPGENCAWIFWDSSAKGARRWCTMRVCGNRAKVRAFARRRSLVSRDTVGFTRE